MLPTPVLRRFVCVLASSKAKVLAEHARRKGGKVERTTHCGTSLSASLGMYEDGGRPTLRLATRIAELAPYPFAATRLNPSRVCGSFRPRMRDATTVRRICAVPPPMVNIRASRAMRSSGRLRE